MATATPATVPVTVENFIRAESDLYFTAVGVKEGFFGKLGHHRDVMPVDHQTIIRTNRDTLYTSGVFDLDAGPVTITLPDASGRFMSLQMITQDEYSPATIYCAGPHTFTREVYDTDRIMFVRAYLTQLQRATADGVPIKGYFYWSSMDNLEWTAGFGNRYGIGTAGVEYAVTQ
jgi:hypothetical protein